MDSLRIKMNKTTWYIDVLVWCRDNAVVWTSFLLGWKGLDLGFKAWNANKAREDAKEAREMDDRIRGFVKDEINRGVAQKLDHLSDKIEMLGDAVLALKTKI